MTNNKKIEAMINIKNIDYYKTTIVHNVPEELLEELDNLRTKFQKQKEARVKTIEKNPEKYASYFKDYHREYYRNKQSKDEKYMEYQRTKALERYYKKKEVRVEAMPLTLVPTGQIVVQSFTLVAPQGAPEKLNQIAQIF